MLVLRYATEILRDRGALGQNYEVILRDKSRDREVWRSLRPKLRSNFER